ncbi:helicase-exonuclease AddAB subunit AddA [Texcoconibacillus texcoconensis]|uniref:ATP-dependent helicase/nuclease subunit A n=1 Tax=Texcoconibacillus texcoconensis TaxID=1095777 RepID=A0A840QT39_9BACI|nr:helicase-exonuclease AddAB subunit AddA [Texcoconibacillus texcoconensis]MBB5174706.1 ATP-dependent helicase/nuclease subunit A [Texcoconibacillus texcoconensis]
MEIRPKPSDVTWTDEQWQAIDAKGSNVLVSAAAGSGKTAVLVERIIRRITDEEPPVDVDRLLIVTFTNAAAAEMRQRIAGALEKSLANDPASLHLRRQLSLLNKASISTLHSFCMNVVRSYYYMLDIDPQFRIVDETEGELIREEVLEHLFEEAYGSGDDELFFDLVDRYSGDRSDEALRNLVFRLYDFSRSHPNPKQWLEEMASRYEIEDDTTIDGLPWSLGLFQDVQRQLQQAVKLIEQAMELTKVPGGPAAYYETFEEDHPNIQALCEQKSWQGLYDAFQSFKFPTLKQARGKDIDKGLKDAAKNLRDAAKKQVNTIKETYFQRAPQSFVRDLQDMAPGIKRLVRLVMEFSERYQMAKKERALVDFADLEHLCLAVLCEGFDEKGTPVASEPAREYQRYFAEVLTDEYQDTNLVQETILRLLSNGSNRFMVGDVKQSIYRFRLAEPGLFLQKYQSYESINNIEENESEGYRIDLAKNFRSRDIILDATNFIFRQLLDPAVGEMDYDKGAELHLGNKDFPEDDTLTAELAVINKGEPLSQTEPGDEPAEMEEELETAQLEARWIVRRIKQMIENQEQVLDKETKRMRPITYRDIVVLMRSMPWAQTMMEECKQAGVPVYADLNTGYFEAIEVSVMISLLSVIDNPYQDIPLASVLRSPIVSLTEQEMAHVRIIEKNGSYYEAVKKTIDESPDETLKQKLSLFYERLMDWRTQAREGGLSELIWRLYQETGYYDFVGGMSGGKQRQANLRALYDRARSYEATSFRGVFRFLRFVERMRERGDDLGTARALGEQEDVVRFMTVHKSKGLEFPVVFLAGMNKEFNKQDIRKNVLLHKEWGFGSKMIDPENRVIYPSLPQLAIKKRLEMESLAEEMRVLYVAMTRAKERLLFVGTVKDAEKSLENWRLAIEHEGWVLPNGDRANAKSFLDWLGPAVMRHKDSVNWQEGISPQDDVVYNDPSRWNLSVIDQDQLQTYVSEEEEKRHEREEAVRSLEPVNVEEDWEQFVGGKLEQVYAYTSATVHRSKQTVSELKRQMHDEYSDRTFLGSFRAQDADRPRFMQDATLTASEIGTAMHTVMQHIPLTRESVRVDRVQSLIDELVRKEILTDAEGQAIDVDKIARFFETPLGERMLQAKSVQREVPFTYGVPASESYADWDGPEDEMVLIQGVVDVILEDADGGRTMIDFKTDTIQGRFPEGMLQAEPVMRDRYSVQIDVYMKAIEAIWQTSIDEAYLYFFDVAESITMK